MSSEKVDFAKAVLRSLVCLASSIFHILPCSCFYNISLLLLDRIPNYKSSPVLKFALVIYILPLALTFVMAFFLIMVRTLNRIAQKGNLITSFKTDKHELCLESGEIYIEASKEVTLFVFKCLVGLYVVAFSLAYIVEVIFGTSKGVDEVFYNMLAGPGSWSLYLIGVVCTVFSLFLMIFFFISFVMNTKVAAAILDKMGKSNV